MGVEASGPVFAAGTEVVTQDGYSLLFLPDVNNEYLQREGKPPVYHWLPNSVRLAQKPNRDYKFSFVHFVGVRSAGTTVGGHDNEEVAGGLVGFSTTAAIPPDTLRAAENQLLDRFRGTDTAYWGWRVPAAPMFRPAPIVSSITSVTNLGPTAMRGIPGIREALLSGTREALATGTRAPAIGIVTSPVNRDFPLTVARSRGYRDSNLDMWYINLQGQGPGAISPLAENAYSGLCGSLPAALIWASFHGGQSPIGVWQNQRIKVWAPLVEIWIDGEWSRIQEHFSGAVHAGGWFWSADIQAQFNNMRMSGVIDVRVKVDPTIPGGEKINEDLNKRTDLVFNKFMEQAQKVIFEPPAFNEKPAEAKGGFLGLGGGAAFKLRRDRVNLSLHYHEKRDMCYLQENTVSGQLEGLYDQLKADPSAEKKYFINLYLEDWDRKVSRVVKPVVNWPDPARKWVGEPVSFLSVQVGYPDTQGAIQWDGHVFQPSDGPDAKWNTAMAKKNQSDVANPPSGWTPDKTFLKRKVHFAEPPSELENPFVRVSVERNEVDLDPGPTGSLIDEINNEVRVDNVGALNVGPIFLGVELEGSKQHVEVTFKAEGTTLDGNERPPVRFTWSAADQNEPRLWMIFTGQPDFVTKYSYQVRVVVKGSLTTHGMEWIGPWVEGASNGSLMVRVPTIEDEGVTVVSRTIVPAGEYAPAAVAGVPAIAAAGRPPARGAGAPPPAAGRPPASSPASAGATGTAPATKAADDPFAVAGFAERDIEVSEKRYIYTEEAAMAGAGVRSAGPRGPAGAPPSAEGSASEKARSSSKAVTVGGYTITDDGPAR
jgi:hypothetical protein